MNTRSFSVARMVAAFVGLSLAACGAPVDDGDELVDETVVDEGESSAAVSGGRLLGIRVVSSGLQLASISPANAFTAALMPLTAGLTMSNIDPFRAVYSSQNGRFYQTLLSPNRIATINPFNDTMTSVPLQRLVDFEMNNQGQLVGACAAPGTTSQMEFCRVDPATGVVTTLNSFGLTSAWNAGPVSAFRAANNRFYILMRLDDDLYHLFTVDAQNGAILNDATVTDQAGFVLHHSLRVNASGQLIAVRRDGANMANVVRIHPTTGVVTMLNANPNLNLASAPTVPTHNAMASQLNALYQLGQNGGQKLITFNATTGAVVSQAALAGEWRSLHHFGPQ